MKLLVVRDQSSKILGHRWLNSQISFYIGVVQLIICIWAMAQHIYSLKRFNKASKVFYLPVASISNGISNLDNFTVYPNLK